MSKKKSAAQSDGQNDPNVEPVEKSARSEREISPEDAKRSEVRPEATVAAKAGKSAGKSKNPEKNPESKMPKTQAEAQIRELQERVAELEAEQQSLQAQQQKREGEQQELKEALLRKQADFENYRRRMQKEKEEAIRFANRSLISELLDVLDNFERALASHRNERDSGPAMKGLFEGLELVEKQLVEMLSGRWGLKAMECHKGAEFDPNFHEAMMMAESKDYTSPTVEEVFQTGYTLHGRVLRPARVKVAQPAAAG
ncbi:MAG: nucleotide exchange factor GrpE [Spirochaetota bacterium]